MLENRNLTKILFNYAIGVDNDFENKINSFYKLVKEEIRAALIKGIKFGIIKDCNINIISSCIFGSVTEVVRDIIYSKENDIKNIDIDEYINSIISFGLNGIYKNDSFQKNFVN